MKKRTIVFRADGGATIGMGHFIRTLALAEMLNEQFHCIYATRNPSPFQINEIKAVCPNYISLPENDNHFDYFLSRLHGDEIVVLDNYYFTTEYQQQIKNKGCKLVCIDDIHDKHFVADIVINHAEGLDRSVYSVEANTKLLLGYKYALLRKEFFENRRTEADRKYSCFLMMGGADPFNLTIRFLEVLNDITFPLPIAVVTGAAFPDSSIQNQTNNIKHFQNISPAKIAELMQQSEFGILPASTVAIEACAIRLPFICGYFIDNQKEIYEGIRKSKLAICIVNFLNLTAGKLIEAITRLENNEQKNTIVKRQDELLDKKSRQRYIQIFKEL